MSIITKIAESFREKKETGIVKKRKQEISNSKEVFFSSIKEPHTDFKSVARENVFSAFFVANMALKKVSGIDFFDNQLEAASFLSEGMFVEMGTGEGKTLAFALAAAVMSAKDNYLVTIVSANDYLSERDFHKNKMFFDELGVSVGFIGGKSNKEERLIAYKCDVLYTTLRESAYDYLRDDRVLLKSELFNPVRNVLLVDEADNVLIDNAQHPYIISEEIPVNESLIIAAHDFALQSKVSEGDEDANYYYADEKRSVSLSQCGLVKLENFLVKHNFLSKTSDLYIQDNIHIIELFECAGHAHFIMIEGLDYIKNENKVVVLDRNSGRPLYGVSLSKGLQQLLEVKFRLNISKELIPTGNITTESFVNLFDNVAGMSGTMKVEEDELISSYGKGCISIPPRLTCIRADHGDIFFTSSTEKTRYTLELILNSYGKGQPVLICTSKESEAKGLSKALGELNVEHELLIGNSLKYEASIIAKAGMPFKVTLTTGIAGRGTDIVLGGNIHHFIENKLIPDDEIEKAMVQQKEYRSMVEESGGLYVIGFGRQSTRKMDLQLRGRAGRQGDKGESVIISSLEDSMLGEYGLKLKSFLNKLSIGESDKLSHPMITKALDNAQRTIRGKILKSRMFNASQSTQLEGQRRAMYKLRMRILTIDDTNITSGLQKIFTESKISSRINNKELALEIFDNLAYSYFVSLEDLKKSVFFQNFANRNPSQELKQKAFKEYEFFISNLVREYSQDHA